MEKKAFKLLHFRDTDKTFGDTHQFYNEYEKKWYMIYLVFFAAPDIFTTRQMVSDDLIHWKKEKFESEDQSVSNRLFFNDILKANGSLFTWVPTREEGKTGAYLECFYLPDGMHNPINGWKVAPEDFFVQNDAEEYYGGLRDYSVFYDESAKKYYCLAIAYHDYSVWGHGTKIEPFLVLFESAGDSPCKWSKKAMRLMQFDLSITGDPECCHMAKIGDRWYLFASPAGFTYRYMGKFTYWVSEKGQALKDIDWETARRYELTGEDLCAGKISFGEQGDIILYGWIPDRWNDSMHSSIPIQWGGNMSFPYLLSQNPDGTLTAKLADGFAEKIRGKLLYQKEFLNQPSIEINAPDSRIDMDICFVNIDKIEITFTNENNMHYAVEMDIQNRCLKVITENLIQTSVQLSNAWMQQNNTLRLVIEEDMLECCLNEKYILPARTCFVMNEKCRIQVLSYSNKKEDMIQWISIHHLNTVEEI